MSSFKDSSWTTLPHYPFSIRRLCSNIVRISDTEFITIHGSVLHKYDTKTNKWDIIYDELDTVMDECIAFDTRKNQIYISGLNTLKIFDINKKTCTNQDFSETVIDCRSSIILINGTLHIIGGTNIDSHFVWNMMEDKQAAKIEKIQSFDVNWRTFGYVYVHTTHKMFCFGGYHSRGRLNQIKKYCIKSKKWTILKCKLSENSNHCGCVIDKSQQYVLILGGYMQHGSMYSDTIQVYDVGNFFFDVEGVLWKQY